MAFCVKCGQQHDDGVKFCSNCGTQTVKSHAEIRGQRQMAYAGEIHKCPNCGEVLDSFSITCPACGYEIRGVKASDSAREFAMKLMQSETEKQKISIVRSFPIPNTKEDILEFLILASTNFDANTHTTGLDSPQKEEFDAWLAKIEQCYQKAKMMIKDDSEFSKIQEIYDQTYTKIKVTRKHHTTKNTISLIAKNAGVWCGILALLIAIGVNISGGNSSMIELIGIAVLIISACTLGRKDAGFIDLSIGALSGILSIVLAFLLDNGSALQLGGGIVLVTVAVYFFRSQRKSKG